MATGKMAIAEISVNIANRQVLATLEIRNESAADVYVEKYNACFGGQIANNIFVILTDAQMLDYVGPLVKRRRPIPEDYVRIASGISFTSNVDLRSAYRFLAGTRKYEAKYSATITYPSEDGYWTLESKPIQFTVALDSP
jgi:hypothetical protein